MAIKYIKECSSILAKNGKISCECCCCSQVLTYGITSSIPPGRGDGQGCDSADYSPSCDGKKSDGSPAACCGESVSGYIRSNNFNCVCKYPKNGLARAIIYKGARIDNIGSIGSANFLPSGVCPDRYDTLNADHIDFPEIVENNDGTFYMKLPFSAANDESCGPYGILNARVKWFFCDEDNDADEGSSGLGIGLSLL